MRAAFVTCQGVNLNKDVGNKLAKTIIPPLNNDKESRVLVFFDMNLLN